MYFRVYFSLLRLHPLKVRSAFTKPFKLYKRGLLGIALPAIGVAVPQLEPRASCGVISDNVNFRRLYNPTLHDHFYTWDGLEEARYWNNGYQFDGDASASGLIDSAGRYFLSPTPRTVPFYRLYNSATSTHLYTTSTSLRDTSLSANPPFVLEGNFAPGIGVSGFVYLDGSCPGTVPLYWAYSAALADNFYTVNALAYNNFIANGYQAKGIAAWIYPPT